MRVYKIQSRSRPNLSHKVTDNGTFWECDCEFWQIHRKCRHVETVKMRIGLRYEPIKGRCEYCHCRQAVDQHHLFKRSQRPDLIDHEGNKVWLCRTCHELTERSHWFLERLQKLFYDKPRADHHAGAAW